MSSELLALANTIGLIILAILQLIGYRDIKNIEKNTNSMKDALVASTAKASRAEGVEAERTAAEDKAAKLAEQRTK